MKYLLLSLITMLTVTACDIIEPPYKKKIEVTPRDTSDTLSPLRNVLLEKFTGSVCTPCPPANDVAKEIHEIYPLVSIISYHAGKLAQPEPSQGYVYDFITNTGIELGVAFFKAPAPENIITPMGVIDRIGFDTLSKVRVGHKIWLTEIPKRFPIPSPVAIRIYPWYDPSTRTLTVSGQVHFLENGFKDYNVTLALVEDSIIKPQKQPDGSKIVDYLHKNVFRSNIPNNAWGTPVSTTDQPKGSQVTFTRNLQFAPDSDWVPKNLKVVGYVYRNFNTPTVSREVLQSTSKKVSIVP